ncbi:MAG TPA: flagellar hook-associated protein FlgL [Candidatus Desulfobacillus sp.]|nr:flagellar hook-associated protein FlgL [Candidatus Desulfobacillus sp.]
MRVSTAMIFGNGLASMQRQSAQLLHTQQQAASGRRMLTPADDPVASARALEVGQAKNTNALYQINQKTAAEALAQQESLLASVGELMHDVRTLAVQGGGGSLNEADRRSIASELRQRFEQLVGFANAADGNGLYLFSGFMGGTKPFSGSVAAGVSYAGDDGQRLQQVSASRQLAVSDSGNEIFMRIRNGNGSFVTSAAATNAGSGVIDGGAVTDPAKWNAPGNGKDFSLRFAVDNSSVPPQTTYDIVDASNNSLLTGLPSVGGPYPRVFTPGQAIVLKSQGGEPAFDFGAQLVITGQPANGDRFDIDASTSQSMFETLGRLIGALESSTGTPAGRTLLANRIGAALTDIDQAQDNLLRVRATVGARLNEIDSLANAGEALDLNYAQTLSRLQDVDYAEAITRLTQQQFYLEAAQKTYASVSGLSLFNYV